jgi:hypothetical protein
MIDFGALRQMVENEIDSYRYEVPRGSLGTPWPATRVEAGLQRMRASLVDPYWANIDLRDTFEQVREEKASVRKCAVVADDGNGTLLAFDPHEEEFVLIHTGKESLESFGVRGDAVGCFLAI